MNDHLESDSVTTENRAEKPNTCVVCEQALYFRWTDTHGVAVCGTCGAPHTVYHYDPETKERLDKPPEVALSPVGIDLAQRYWTERKAMVFPACYDMGFGSRGDSTYSGATRQDTRAFEDWLDQQPESIAGAQA